MGDFVKKNLTADIGLGNHKRKVAMVGMTIATMILTKSQCRCEPVLPSVPPHPLFCPLTSDIISVKEKSTFQDAGLP
jgi:hypothetical protein